MTTLLIICGIAVYLFGVGITGELFDRDAPDWDAGLLIFVWPLILPIWLGTLLVGRLTKKKEDVHSVEEE